MADTERLRARFVLTPRTATIVAQFREGVVTMRWARAEDGSVGTETVNTLINQLPDLLKDATAEVYVQEQAKGLDMELNKFFEDRDDG